MTTTQLTTSTPAGIELMRFVSLRGMLKLESVGMKTRGGSLRPRLADEFGLKPRAPYATYIAAVQLKIDFCKAAVNADLA